MSSFGLFDRYRQPTSDFVVFDSSGRPHSLLSPPLPTGFLRGSTCLFPGLVAYVDDMTLAEYEIPES